MSLVGTERVLVVSTELLHRLGYFQGFTADVDRYLEQLLDPAHTSYRPRSEMEEDPSHKQLIPYVIFRHLGRGGEVTVFQYLRGKGQGEQRLHSKRSIGIGGHISADDECQPGAVHPYQEGMRRELAEEVIIRTRYTDRLVGLINDDETDVGKVHLGVVHLFDVETPDIEPREPDIMGAGFRSIPDLFDDVETLETWSRICLEALFGPGQS